MEQLKKVTLDLELFEAPFFFFSLNTEGEFVYLSRSVEDVLGIKLEHLLQKKCTAFLMNTTLLGEDHSPPTPSDAKNLDVDRQPLIEFKERVLRIHTYQKQSNSKRNETHCGIAIDVTERFRHEEKLRHRLDEINRLTEQLSPKERRVLAYLPQGRTIKNIARALNLSPRGIEHIKSRLTRKLDVDSTAQLIGIVREQECLVDFFE